MNNIVSYVFRFLFRIKWWVLFGSLAMSLIGYYLTRNMAKEFEVTSSIYTGVVSGVDIVNVDGVAQRVDQVAINNSMDNLINILTSKTTLRNVSMRLFVQHLMYGNPNKDNSYITAANYRYVYSHTPQEVRDLIDKDSEERSLANLYEYEQSSPENYVYGLFNWFHPFYSYSALSKIKVKRAGNSDMIDIYYAHTDPGIAYHTILLLENEFISQYKGLRYGEVDEVIKYFEDELAAARERLTLSEDSLTKYNIEKKVIHYDKQSEVVASLGKEYDLVYMEVQQRVARAQEEAGMLDKYIDESVKQMRNNVEFISRLKKISDISTEMANMRIFGLDSASTKSSQSLAELQNKYNEAEGSFLDYTRTLSGDKYTKEGLQSNNYVQQWLQAQIDLAEAQAELEVVKNSIRQLDDRYTSMSPVGTTIKRKEREIHFNENTYMSILNSLNQARLRRKSLQLNSASLKIINPPIFPIASVPTKRKMIIALLFFGTALFIIGYFLLVELLDKTLKNKFKAEWITGGKVIAAFPRPVRRYRKYNAECEAIAVHYLANALLNCMVQTGDRKGPKIINIISIERKEGKQMLANRLAQYWENIGLKVRVLMWGEDFIPEGKEYMLSGSLQDIYNGKEEDIVLIVHPAFRQSSIPVSMLGESSLNLLVADANRAWSEADRMIYENIVEKSAGVPVVFCLTSAARGVVEDFTGILPPVTKTRLFLFNLSQFRFSSGS